MDKFKNLIKVCDKNIIIYTNELTELRSLLQSYDENKKNIEKESNDLINIKRSIHYSSYLIISILELSVSLKNLIIAPSDWERIFFIKNSYLTIYETLKLLKPENNSSGILDENIKSNNLKDLKSDLKKINSDITNFKSNENFQIIAETRHEAGAHINKKLTIYYDTIYKLDGEKAGEIIIEFLIIVSSLQKLCRKVQYEMLKIFEEKFKKSQADLDDSHKKLKELKGNTN